MKSAAKQVKSTTVSVVVDKPVRIGDAARDAVIALHVANTDATPQDVVAALKAAFPQSKVNVYHVYWYTKQLRALGVIAQA